MTIQQTEPASEGAKPRIYSAPRTFDFATVLVITAAYALLFAALRAMGAPLTVIAIIASFFTVVGLAQALLFGGTKPRLASLLAGAGFMACIFLPSRFPRPIDLVFEAIAGAFFGYLAGAIVGGVFLAAEKVRNVYRRRIDAGPRAAEDESWQ